LGIVFYRQYINCRSSTGPTLEVVCHFFMFKWSEFSFSSFTHGWTPTAFRWPTITFSVIDYIVWVFVMDLLGDHLLRSIGRHAVFLLRFVWNVTVSY
ncbi:unnamed protein product, partial [Musa textilis]